MKDFDDPIIGHIIETTRSGGCQFTPFGLTIWLYWTRVWRDREMQWYLRSQR